MPLTPDEKRRKRNEKLRGQKYEPLAPGIENKLQLRRSINRRAKGAIAPKLGAVNRDLQAETQAHEGRERDLTGMYDTYTTDVEDAYKKAQEAAQSLFGTSASAIGGSQANLLAALEQSRAQDLSQATTVGGVLPQGIGDEVATQAAGAGSSALAGLAASLGSGVGRAADRIGTAGLAQASARGKEQSRFLAKQQQLRGERKEVQKELPTAREEARKEIEDAELARASERNRENIARKSLNLEKRKTSNEEKQIDETQRSNEANESIAWAGIRTEKEKYRMEVEEAGSGAEQEAAEAQAQRYDRGVEVFQRYFENTKPKAYDPKSLYRNLTLAVGKDTALKIMSHGPPKFQEFVRKRRSGGEPTGNERREHEGRTSQPGVPSGPRNSG
jgi:hypothetical protein